MPQCEIPRGEWCPDLWRNLIIFKASTHSFWTSFWGLKSTFIKILWILTTIFVCFLYLAKIWSLTGGNTFRGVRLPYLQWWGWDEIITCNSCSSSSKGQCTINRYGRSHPITKRLPLRGVNIPIHLIMSFGYWRDISIKSQFIDKLCYSIQTLLSNDTALDK